jgi:Arc/MetJ-type ribon-helix-helix transcriptional regulator
VTGERVSVRLDALQVAWLDALAAVHNVSRSDVLRLALSYLSARESARIARTRHYDAVALAARAQRWDPISDFLAGRPITPP